MNKKKPTKSKRRHSATVRNEDLEPEFWILNEQIDAFRLYLGRLQPCLSRVAHEQKGQENISSKERTRGKGKG